jgi:hypothetical protein
MSQLIQGLVNTVHIQFIQHQLTDQGRELFRVCTVTHDVILQPYQSTVLQLQQKGYF